MREKPLKCGNPGVPRTREGGLLGDFLREAEQWLIRDALERNGFNIAHTAQELGIDRSSLYRRAERLGMSLKRKIVAQRMTPEFRRFLSSRAL